MFSVIYGRNIKQPSVKIKTNIHNITNQKVSQNIKKKLLIKISSVYLRCALMYQDNNLPITGCSKLKIVLKINDTQKEAREKDCRGGEEGGQQVSLARDHTEDNECCWRDVMISGAPHVPPIKD